MSDRDTKPENSSRVLNHHTPCPVCRWPAEHGDLATQIAHRHLRHLGILENLAACDEMNRLARIIGIAFRSFDSVATPRQESAQAPESTGALNGPSNRIGWTFDQLVGELRRFEPVLQHSGWTWGKEIAFAVGAARDEIKRLAGEVVELRKFVFMVGDYGYPGHAGERAGLVEVVDEWVDAARALLEENSDGE